MNEVDAGVLRFLNQFAHHSRLLDLAVVTLTSNPFFKGELVVAVFWWVWFRPGQTTSRDREIVIASFASACLAVVVGRLLALYLPFRLRPLQAASLDFVMPYGVTPDSMRNWSSFPSDHAMVFFALVAGLCFVSRRLGALVGLYVSLFVAMPRVYAGMHYPSDILAGAAVGVLIACVANLRPLRSRLAAPALKWSDLRPASFYALFFLFSTGLATMFDAIRHFGQTLWYAARGAGA